MPDRHPPGYHARRARIRNYIVNHYRTCHPADYERAKGEAEQLENERDA